MSLLSFPFECIQTCPLRPRLFLCILFADFNTCLNVLSCWSWSLASVVFQGKLTVWKLNAECQIKWDWIQSISRTSCGRKANITGSPCSVLMQDSPQTVDIIMFHFKPEVNAPREKNQIIKSFYGKRQWNSLGIRCGCFFVKMLEMFWLNISVK